MTAYRSLTALERTGMPGPEGSILKLQWSEANQRVTALALDLLGPDAQLLPPNGPYGGYWAVQQLRSRGNTIEAGHLRDPPQHRRRARARPAEVELAMDLAFTELQDELRAQARGFLEATPEPTWAALAELGWTGAGVAEEHGGAGLSFLEEAVIHEEAGRALLHAPLWSTSSLVPFLPADDQAAVAAGTASWTLALGPLVPDLDTATNVAVPGGDTVWELEGFEREVLPTNDATRPLGVVSGGEPGRALFSSEALPTLRSRSLAILALEAVGVGARALELAIEYVKDARAVRPPDRLLPGRLAPAGDGVHRARARPLARVVGGVVRLGGRPGGAVAAAAAGAEAADAAVATCERAIQAHGGIGFTWEHVLHRLYKRALGIRSWEASSAQLRAEVASHLLDKYEKRDREAGAFRDVPRRRRGSSGENPLLRILTSRRRSECRA